MGRKLKEKNQIQTRYSSEFHANTNIVEKLKRTIGFKRFHMKMSLILCTVELQVEKWYYLCWIPCTGITTDILMILLSRSLKHKCCGSKINFNLPKTKGKESLSWATSRLGKLRYSNFIHHDFFLKQTENMNFIRIVSEATHLMIPSSGIYDT